MAVTFATLFTRLGALEDLRQKIVTQQTLLETEVDDILDEFNDDRDMAVGLEEQLEAHIASTGSMLGLIRSVASKTLIEMVHADNPLPAKTERLAIVELIKQMDAGAPDDVDGTTVSSSEAAGGSNVGNGTLLVDLTNGLGKTLEHVKAESLVATCTADAQTGKRTAGQEVFAIRGEAAKSVDDRAWPAGSGISRTIRVSSPDIFQNATDSPGQNMLFNGNMETFTVLNTPDGWTYIVGAAGTDFLTEGTIVYRGDTSIEFVGDGATLNDMAQTFNKSGDTLGKMFPQRRYMLGLRVRASAAVAAGVMRVRIEDSGGTEVGSSSFTVDLTATSTGAFDLESQAFSSPLDIPASVICHIELTTAITAGQSVFIDDVFMVPMIQVGGPRGPNLCIVPGSTDFVKDDVIVSTITNNNEGEFQRAFDRWFDMGDNHLPSQTDGSETQSDALIA